MFIQFNKITVKNFMSTGNTPVIVQLDKSNKTLIRGFNGNGKSVLLHALTYALFGRAYAKITLPSLVNSVNMKDCVVQLEFTIGSTSYKIIRGMKPKKFEIYKDDVLIEQDSLNKDYQAYLEEFIIKMNFDTYCQLMALGSMSYVPFLQLKATDRRAFVEFMLSIEIFTGMNKQLKDQITKNKNELFTLEVGIDSSKTVINNLEDVIKWANADTSNRINEIKSNIATLVTDYRKQEDVVNALQRNLDLLIFDDTIINNTKVSIDKCNKIVATKEAELGMLRKKITFLKDNAVCNVCGQDVDDEHRDTHMTEYNAEMTNTGEVLLKVKNKLQEFTDEYESLNKKSREKHQLTSKLQLETHRLSTIKQDVLKLKAEQSKLEENSQNDLVAEKQDALQKENVLLQNKLADNNKALTTKRVLDIMASDLKDNGAKADIIKTYIPIINSLVNKYLQQMNLFVKFELDENFNETLKSRHRDEFTIESFSMGERMRVSVALLFAWRELTKIRTGISSNLLFVDEIMEIGDVMLFESFLQVISEDNKLNCFMISHKTGIEMYFDDILQVQKVKGFTQVQLEK